jgi:hypothetical protein
VAGLVFVGHALLRVDRRRGLFVWMITQLQHLVGRQIKDVDKLIEAYARAHGCRVNVQDKEFNPGNIDVDDKRLNVMVDGNSVITGFKVG